MLGLAPSVIGEAVQRITFPSSERWDDTFETDCVGKYLCYDWDNCTLTIAHTLNTIVYGWCLT